MRDIVAGFAVLALLVQSSIALGDKAVILAARGPTKAALGMHDLTGALMIGAAVSLVAGIA